VRSKRYIFTLLIAIFVLFGCAREGFVVSSVSLSREIVLSVDSTGSCELENESININSRIEPNDGKYTFKLTSPDGDLSWEGALNGGRGVSDALLITPGATFLSGEYNLIIYSEEGSVYSTSVNLADAEYDSYPYFDENKTLIADESVTINIYIDGYIDQTYEDVSSGFVLDTAFDSVEIETFDRYQNRVIVKQNFK
jgi:hypothetical protein